MKPRLVTRFAVGVERCSCGTPLAPGSSLLTFEGVPDLVAPLFRNRSFCGVSCARTFVLEALETFQAGWTSAVVSDTLPVVSLLRQVYLYAVAEP